ncbi:ATP-binding cassette domain-containing protein [Streptomyces sp. NPDC059443]|uniref:ATP-binding cassette domain-containing protein n=1 Tax=unclassified Streptomyces TaxID=2593676 RepID=UPI0036814195
MIPVVSDSERLLFGGELAYDIGWDKHEGAWLRLGLWAMARDLPGLAMTGVRLARLADARALRTVLAAELGRGVAQAVGLVAVNHVLGHILAAGTTNERLVRAVPALAVVAVTALAGSLLRSASTAATGALEPKVQRVATERYLGLVHQVELSAIEDDEFHRLLDAARYGADSARRMIRNCTNTLNALISLVAAASVLTVLHPVLLPLLIVMTRLARRAARVGLIADGAGGLATLLTHGALGLLLWSGAMELAVAGTAVLAIRTGASSLDARVLQVTELHQESLFVADFDRLCEEARARAIPATGEDLPEEVREVRFEKVTFTYPASGKEVPEPTLREVSLTLPLGKVIAVVGENGSGKSTLVKLLAGLHQPDPEGGTIRWDDVDAARADRA